ncbi:MAG TPA: S26 family signal peptidase [Actinomycetota bacterium]|nr:S26 family signal peptidase [Actinomycetota bacterium]
MPPGRALPLRRFVVADRSMEPGLVAGQGLITTHCGRAKPGQLRCFEHPGRPGFWLVKRVAQVHGDGSMTVTSDNPAGVDSSTFGAVPVAGSYRVLLAVPKRFM